jgi:hypothetical protein
MAFRRVGCLTWRNPTNAIANPGGGGVDHHVPVARSGLKRRLQITDGITATTRPVEDLPTLRNPMSLLSTMAVLEILRASVTGPMLYIHGISTEASLLL